MKQAELNKILELHNLWVLSHGDNGTQANLLDANFSNMDFSGANLKDADLTDANLFGANLQCANLRRANLAGINLAKANLSGADLSNADLYGADLSGADLHAAVLSEANIKYAGLFQTNLQNANLYRANLGHSSLSTVIGLPDISWIDSGCLVRLLSIIAHGFYVPSTKSFDNFTDGLVGFLLQNNNDNETFDMMAGDRIIRSIPNWVKYSGISKLPANT